MYSWEEDLPDVKKSLDNAFITHGVMIFFALMQWCCGLSCVDSDGDDWADFLTIIPNVALIF